MCHMDIAQIIAEPQHHAYILFGYAPEELRAQHCAGLHGIHLDTALGVDEVRELSGYAFQASDGVLRKIVVSTPSVSFQAQNALLKMLEEAEDSVCFFLCVPRGTDILGTLLSRCYVVDKAVGDSVLSDSFTEFIGTNAKERLALLDAIWDQGESVRHSSILQLLQDFDLYIHQRIVSDDAVFLKQVARCKRVVQNVRSGVYEGALHKGTLQALAFVEV